MTEIQPIIIVASYGTGSSALTGFLDYCGAHTCPPHQGSRDKRTPTTFEPLAYADALRKLFYEPTLTQQGTVEEFETFFRVFWQEELQRALDNGCNHIVLKHPLQILILDYLQNYINPKYLFLTRPMQEIERSRLRRRWHPIYGASGAVKLQKIASEFMIKNSCPYLSVPYRSLLTDRAFRQTILDYCGLKPTVDMLKCAERWLGHK